MPCMVSNAAASKTTTSMMAVRIVATATMTPRMIVIRYVKSISAVSAAVPFGRFFIRKSPPPGILLLPNLPQSQMDWL
jgi:hypothetical protein